MILGPSMAGTVPKWVTEPYQKIHEDEEEHGNYPFDILVKYATTPEKTGTSRARRPHEPGAAKPILRKSGPVGFRR